MIWIIITAIAIMLLFTILSFRRNSVIMLSLSFIFVYIIEISLYYFSQSELLNFFITLGAKYPPDIGVYTAIYLHSLSPGHIFFNILFFFLAGIPFEQRVGDRRLTTVFLVSGITANLIYSLFLYFSGHNSLLIGASGAIFGVMGAFIVMYPNDEITFFLGPILMPRVKVKFAILALIVVEFASTLLWIQDNVAHGAHVIGAVTGAVMGYYYLKKGIAVKITAKKINPDIFEELATDEKLRSIYERIKSEDDERIQRIWIEKFFTEKFGKVKIEGKYAISKGEKYRIYR